ncbi:hypothetical protein Tco_0667178 [Tanacetum coccineum]
MEGRKPSRIMETVDIMDLIPSALKTWFQIYGFLLKFPMMNMRYKESHIGENNVRPDVYGFYGYARGMQSRHDVYSTKRILAVTQVEVMRKHGYEYLKEIVVRRADNDLFRFKEGDFPRLRINDIEDMLPLAKKINVTKLETTKSGIRKRDPYTPYQGPQGFIYVDNNGRNGLMRSDKLYKFSDRTLIGLRTSLDDITKNIRMEYLPKRRWSTFRLFTSRLLKAACKKVLNLLKKGLRI